MPPLPSLSHGRGEWHWECGYISQLQSEWSLSCDHGLDYASNVRTTTYYVVHVHGSCEGMKYVKITPQGSPWTKNAERSGKDSK